MARMRMNGVEKNFRAAKKETPTPRAGGVERIRDRLDRKRKEESGVYEVQRRTVGTGIKDTTSRDRGRGD